MCRCLSRRTVAIATAHVEKMFEIMDARDEMADALAAGQPDPQAVRELHGRMAKLQGELLQSRIEARNRMLELLTDDQRERLRALRGRFGPWATD